jgi:signal transduction histidine kinase
MTRFRTLRGRLTALGLLAALAAVAVLTVAFNVVLDRSLNADANSRVRSLAEAAVTTVTYANGRLSVHETADDAAVDRRVWIYQGTRPIERPTTTPDLQRTADALAGRDHVFEDVPGGDVRLYAAAVRADGRQVGTVVAAQSLAAYDRTTDLALLGSLALAAVLLAAVAVLTWLTVGRALDPVREMTASAADWSERDLAQRFGATPRPDELGDLARTFDALLDRVAASLRHEQRLSAELSHELRTPLARIVAEIELLQRRERSPEDRRDAYALVARSAEQMSEILETLMAAARAESQLEAGRSELGRVLDRIASGWAATLAERDLELDVRRPPAPLMAGVDAEVVERIVAPLLDNARRYARARVSLSAVARDGALVVTVGDDGPGVAPDARELLFEPGARTAAVNGHRGAGLGLPLARRLANAIGGDVTLAPPARGAGAQFEVRLPA